MCFHTSSTSTLEPILVPKLRICFADFPYLLCSITRGCSPWGPAAVISTPPWTASLGSSRPVACFPDSTNAALPTLHPPRQPSCFRGPSPLTRKDHSSRSLRQSLQVHCVAASLHPVPEYQPDSLSGPRPYGPSPELTSPLGPTHPTPFSVQSEPFPTSVFKVPLWIFATPTKICTRGCSMRPRGLHSLATPTPSYSSELPSRPDGIASVSRFSAIHFQGCFIRQVSHNTLLSGCRLSWPPPCCLDEPTPFLVSHERALWHLSYAFGSSRIASSAYQKWPTWHSHSSGRSSKHHATPYPFKVWE